MGKRNRRETAYETRLYERALQRQDAKEAARFDGVYESNRAGRRLIGERKPEVPKFHSPAQADAWMERKAKQQARLERERERALAVEAAKQKADADKFVGMIQSIQVGAQGYVVIPGYTTVTNIPMSAT